MTVNMLDVVSMSGSLFFLESQRLMYEHARALAPVMHALIRVRARFGE